MIRLNGLAIGAASLFAIVAANHGQISRAHHHNPLLERSEAHLQKRFGGQATYYAVGLGACGEHNVPSDYIVALNSAQFGSGYPGPNCFKMINICDNANGKCANAQIMDECPTCNYGSLDLSQGLFEHFASTNDGVFQMTWSFLDGNSGSEPTKTPNPPKATPTPDPPKNTPKPSPTTTTKEPEQEPTTTSKKHTTTTQPETTSTPEPTTTSSTSTSSVPETTSTSKVKSTMTTSTVSASASPSAVPGSGSGSGASGSNWVDMAQVMLAMGRIAAVAHS